MRASAAISIATNAGLRTGAGMIPSPTLTRDVAARAVAVVAMPPAKKQSSHSQSSSKPASSTARASPGSASGGCSGRTTKPRAVKR